MSFFEDLEKKISTAEKCKVVIPCADNKELAAAIKKAMSKGFIAPILIGNKEKLESIYGDTLSSPDTTFIESSEEIESIRLAMNLMKENKADLLMKGMNQTVNLIKAILDKSYGFCENRFISHQTFFQLPDKESFMIMSDAAVNVAPDEETMVKEIENAAISFQHYAGRNAKVALLAANEKVTPKIVATVIESSACEKFIGREDLIVEGPLSFDLAISHKSAQIKKYTGKIQGDADVLICPRIETSNALYKSLQHNVSVPMGGIVFGASIPIALCSRSDNQETKYNSLLLGILEWQRMTKGN